MPISIRARCPSSPGFAGEVSGIAITRPIGRVNVAAIEAGMDAYAVRVFRGQELADAQPLAFTLNFGGLEVEDLVSEHSPVSSREAIDLTDLTPEEIAAFGPVRHRRARRLGPNEVRDVRRIALAGDAPPVEQEPVA